MRVRVRLLGSLRQPSTSKEIEYDLPESSDVFTLIRKIITDYPKLDGVLDNVGNLVMLEGVEAGTLEGHKTKLNDGIEIIFMPVTHGGR